jgi:hypothetical protein
MSQENVDIVRAFVRCPETSPSGGNRGRAGSCSGFGCPSGRRCGGGPPAGHRSGRSPGSGTRRPRMSAPAASRHGDPAALGAAHARGSSCRSSSTCRSASMPSVWASTFRRGSLSLLAWAWFGAARLGGAGPGWAWQGMESTGGPSAAGPLACVTRRDYHHATTFAGSGRFSRRSTARYAAAVPCGQGRAHRPRHLADAPLVPGARGGGAPQARPLPASPHVRHRGARGRYLDL